MLDMFADNYAAAAAPRANEGHDLPATFGESFQDAGNPARTRSAP